jgi:predicted nucleic acid-binding protein
MGPDFRLQERTIPPVTLLVDTSVWSLALRRDAPPALPEVGALRTALESGELVVSTGLILQELLQGFAGPRAQEAILDRFNALPFLIPERRDHVEAAVLRNQCRRKGIQVGTIDALLAALCIRHGLSILTRDDDFIRISEVAPLSVWDGR